MKVIYATTAWIAVLSAGFAVWTEAAPPPSPPAAAGIAAQPAVVKPQEPAVSAGKTITAGVRVIVIDPGHGGIDVGVSTTGALEKDIALAVARKLRTILQSRLGATVLLTRDSDVALTSEARAAVANNNRADLFISPVSYTHLRAHETPEHLVCR